MGNASARSRTADRPTDCSHPSGPGPRTGRCRRPFVRCRRHSESEVARWLTVARLVEGTGDLAVAPRSVPTSGQGAPVGLEKARPGRLRSLVVEPPQMPWPSLMPSRRHDLRTGQPPHTVLARPSCPMSPGSGKNTVKSRSRHAASARHSVRLRPPVPMDASSGSTPRSVLRSMAAGQIEPSARVAPLAIDDGKTRRHQSVRPGAQSEKPPTAVVHLEPRILFR
jgi:hypothetical protein